MHIQRAMQTFPSANRNGHLCAGKSIVALGHLGHHWSNTQERAKLYVPVLLKMAVESEVGHIV